jgi:hypothetical protein
MGSYHPLYAEVAKYELADECEFTEAMFSDTVWKDHRCNSAEDQFNPTGARSKNLQAE